MSTAARLASFAALLVVVFFVALWLGRQFDLGPASTHRSHAGTHDAGAMTR